MTELQRRKERQKELVQGRISSLIDEALSNADAKRKQLLIGKAVRLAEEKLFTTDEIHKQARDYVVKVLRTKKKATGA